MLFGAACDFTGWLIHAFEQRTRVSITHSPFRTFLARVVVWGGVIAPVVTIFLVGLGTVVTLVKAPLLDGTDASLGTLAAAEAIPLIIGMTIGAAIGTAAGGGRAMPVADPEVPWPRSPSSWRGDLEGGLRLGEEVDWR